MASQHTAPEGRKGVRRNRPRPAARRTPPASSCPPGGQGDRRGRRARRSQQSRGSQRTLSGLGPRRARERPRWQACEWSSCMAQRAPVRGEELLHRETARRPGDDRCLGAHTTTPRPEPVCSRRRSGIPEGREIAPRILGVERFLVVGGVTCVELRRPLPSEEGFKSRIEKGGVVRVRSSMSCSRQQLLIDGGADTDPGHGISMPLLCHDRQPRHSPVSPVQHDEGPRPLLPATGRHPVWGRTFLLEPRRAGRSRTQAPAVAPTEGPLLPVLQRPRKLLLRG